MQTNSKFKISLDESSKKGLCCSCGKKTSVGYINNETGEMLPNQVARCDRESSCGYHYTPKQYYTDLGHGYTPLINKGEGIGIKAELVDFMPSEFLNKSMYGYYETCFAIWLRSLFGVEIGNDALQKYFVGKSKNDNGKACIFWRIDEDENVRTGKIMCYDSMTGKRNKDIHPTWVHSSKSLQPFNYKLCFFGEHLLSEYPDKTVGIVESEKTAIVASIFMPDMVWIATGGNSGCKWREWSVFKVLKNRNVILYPDFGYFNHKTKKTCFEEWSERAKAISERMPCSITVSKVLEGLPVEDRINDYDLADLLIKTEKPGSLAVEAIGSYPAIWDLKFSFINN